MIIEEWHSFKSRLDWSQWYSVGRPIVSESALRNSVDTILKNGINSNFFGYVAPEHIKLDGTNYREKLTVKGLNSRQRAVLEMLALEKGIGASGSAKIFAPEAVTQLALTVRGRFPYFLGSEYSPDSTAAKRIYPIQSEDLQALSLPTGIFDATFSCDVLEHVPDIQLSLSEMARILKPQGIMISTFPFTWRQEAKVKAVLEQGAVKHLEPAEYHGNPVDPEGGSLVFTVPGWNILEDCISAGFSKAEMRMIASTKLGIFGDHSTPFLNVLYAVK